MNPPDQILGREDILKVIEGRSVGSALVKIDFLAKAIENAATAEGTTIDGREATEALVKEYIQRIRELLVLPPNCNDQKVLDAVLKIQRERAAADDAMAKLDAAAVQLNCSLRAEVARSLQLADRGAALRARVVGASESLRTVAESDRDELEAVFKAAEAEMNEACDQAVPLSAREEMSAALASLEAQLKVELEEATIALREYKAEREKHPAYMDVVKDLRMLQATLDALDDT